MLLLLKQFLFLLTGRVRIKGDFKYAHVLLALRVRQISPWLEVRSLEVSRSVTPPGLCAPRDRSASPTTQQLLVLVPALNAK